MEDVYTAVRETVRGISGSHSWRWMVKNREIKDMTIKSLMMVMMGKINIFCSISGYKGLHRVKGGKPIV